ncbi:hypothetical protein P2H44_03100 [Albimonas sp. CAU 1670]|uniref:hypothetical protein n=1 Tax=Albimonas sp. CAU 1670 TaxID=3032599 RepID=UPI0023DCE0DA|nr:hypothetical protein [Albimonas sp. CAU 1670]MDF2231532.1 hypothetical protein [Albimonas sp. CAU 1670]
MSELSKAEQGALAAIPGLTDPERLRTLMTNAKSYGSAAVERAAFSRLCEIQPSAEPGTLEHDVWRSVFALEEMLREERGKTTLLSRTRQKIAKDGEAKTCADLTLKPQPSAGFDMLVERGLPELLFESVVLRNADRFPSEVIEAAQERLRGIQAPQQG